MTDHSTDSADYRPDTIIGPDGCERRVIIAKECGEVFAEGEDFDGMTVVIEITSVEEGDTILALLDATGRAGTWPVPIKGEVH